MIVRARRRSLLRGSFSLLSMECNGGMSLSIYINEEMKFE